MSVDAVYLVNTIAKIMFDCQIEYNPLVAFIINIIEVTQKFDVGLTHLSKSQKKCINKNKIKKELNQANSIVGNKTLIVEFNDNSFKDKELNP